MLGQLKGKPPWKSDAMKKACYRKHRRK